MTARTLSRTVDAIGTVAIGAVKAAAALWVIGMVLRWIMLGLVVRVDGIDHCLEPPHGAINNETCLAAAAAGHEERLSELARRIALATAAAKQTPKTTEPRR